MDIQTLFNIAIFAGMSALGWFARELWGAVKELKADLSTLREEIAKDYVSKNDFRDALRDVKDMLDKIFDRLDRKVDK